MLFDSEPLDVGSFLKMTYRPKACRVRRRSSSLARSRLCLREALSRLPVYAIYTLSRRSPPPGPSCANSFDDSRSAIFCGDFVKIFESDSPSNVFMGSCERFGVLSRFLRGWMNAFGNACKPDNVPVVV
jgi:hypothetical protein